MNKYHDILKKLDQFIKKFYTKKLIKGMLLFLALGLIFFLVIMGVEHFLWLSSTGRLILLLVFIAVELYLLFKYIITPLIYLFRIKKGIDNKEASKIIGRHFSEVGDKLLNLLHLAEDNHRSELLLASISQRSEKLDTIPFVKAINFNESLKYAKYLLVPFLIIGLIWVSGNLDTFFGSYKRVVNYDLAYEQPAPFSFKLLSSNLEVLESETLTILVTTEGELKPDNIFLVLDGVELLMQEKNGLYQYTFSPPLQDHTFYFRANGIQSRDFNLRILKAPAIHSFNVVLNYPNYTNKPNEVLKSTGNATIPEGTNVKWEILGQHTSNINLVSKDTSLAFSKDENQFELSKRIYKDFSYQIATSNNHVKNHETLDYQLVVIKDVHPSIKATQVMDSLNPNVSYYIGEASDDYKISKIRLVCYPNNEVEKKQSVSLGEPRTNFHQFYYTFPSGLMLDEGKQYSFYFEAVDNDAIHNGKSARSEVFTTAILNKDELRNKELQSQQSIIDNIDKYLEKFKEQKETLKEINTVQKEKNELNFNDKNQVKDFLKKQQLQEGLMEKFSRELKENLNKNPEENELSEMLKERLERQELEAKRNEKLIEELNKIADKIDKADLAKRLEELGKKQQNSERNLEQLLELTKRYYVTEMAAQLAKDLEKLAEKQEILSEQKIGEDFSDKEQKKLNEQFEKIAEELEELKKDNQDLKKPLELDVDKSKSEEVQQDQKDALEEINKYQGEEQSSESGKKQKNAENAKQKQKSAAQKMNEMSQKLGSSSSGGGGGSTITEDAEMLRQILDNLVVFSFKQENLFDKLETSDYVDGQFSESVRKQQELRSLFEHVDDSLFALSLRRAELSEFVNEQITEVYYNIDKSLELLAENQLFQGVSYQKYVLNASNSLADFLANVLDNMQSSMSPSSGNGDGNDFQLPDIIKKQGELQKKMEGMGQKGEGKPKNGEKGKGEKGKGDSQGKDSGQPGNEKEGQQGTKEGQGESTGEGGKSNGKKGKGRKDGQNGSQGDGGLSEEELKEIYEIYKSQQILRENLEQQLKDLIKADERKLGEKLLRQMEDFENDLIENGVTQRSRNKMNTIQYQLLKLENAALKQGKKQERKSDTNKQLFQNVITTKPSLLDNYRNEVEILNKQALPLRQNFQKKVKEYFKNDD